MPARSGTSATGLLAAVLGPAPVVRVGDAHRDAVDPGPQPRSGRALEGGELPVHDDEHLLTDVLEVGLADAEATNEAENEGRAGAEHGVERRARVPLAGELAGGRGHGHGR